MTVEANQDWLKLDNAAKIYPAASSKDAPAVFRLSTTFDKPIRIAALQQAYARVLGRCPYFQVYLRRGVFWYYLQKHNQVPTIQLLDRLLRLEMPIHQRNTPLLRVQARGASMAIDFSHILTDGIGGMRFFTSVMAEYLRLCGIKIERWDALLDPQDESQPEEFEDGHRQHFDSGLPAPPKLSPAYHLPGEAAGTTPYRILSGRMPLSDMLALAKSHEVSLTEYLVALYMDAIARVREQEQHRGRRVRRSVIRVEVPVNMRPYYASQTMRNFSLFVSPEIDLSLGTFTLEEIVRKVHLSMRMQLDRKELQRQISRNVAGELNPLVRVTPLVLKDLLLSEIHRRWGSVPYSGVLSNLGIIRVPSGVSRHVKSFGCVLDPNPALRKNCSVLSFQDELTVTFGSTVESRDLERFFFTSLTQAGVSVQVKES